MKRIYLDHAAATAMRPEVLKVMKSYFADRFYNPSATYLAGRTARNELNQARAVIAGILGARPAEVIFTAGATEANNLAIQGVMRQFPDGEVLVSAVEHESVLAPARLFSHKTIPVDSNGQILLNKLTNLITDSTVLVSVGLVNNEIGTIQSLREVSALVRHVQQQRKDKANNTPLYLHTDAAQAANYLDLHVSRLGVDLMSLNGGKIYGPKQSGCLYIKAGIKLQPIIVGGGQEYGYRAGTENLSAAAGFAEALRLAADEQPEQTKRLAKLRDNFETELLKKIPDSTINGGRARAPHISSVTIARTDNERLMFGLDERGVECAVGSACSASSDEPSHVLTAIGLDVPKARATLRFSFGRETSAEELAETVRILSELTSANR